MLDQSHSAISRPTLLVVVADQVLVVGIRVGREVTLNQITRFFCGKAEHDVDPVDVARVETDRVARFSGSVSELEEIVRHLRRSSHFTSSRKTENEEIENETIVLEDERGELKTSDHSVTIDMGHILIGEDDVVLGGTVISQVVIHDQTQETIE